MSVADDFGRYYANAALIRAHCYPLRLDEVSDSDIGKWLTDCVNAGLVRVYPAEDGKRYLEIRKFEQQVRAKKSRFPDECAASSAACNADAAQVPSKCIASAPVVVVESVVVSEDVVERGAARKSRALATQQSDPRGTRLQPEWVLPPEWASWALTERSDLTMPEVERMGLAFRDHWLGKAGKDARRADWLATWRNWVRNERRNYGRRDHSSAKERGLAVMDAVTGKTNGRGSIEGVARRVDKPALPPVPGDLRKPPGLDVGGDGT